MKILLTTLNSQYVHSNPALKYLYTVAAGSPYDIKIREFTINNEKSYIFGELMREEADLVCFSCYIWNIEETKELIADFKKASPKTKILLGGPEVSFDSHVVMVNNPCVDFVISGEGEYPFFRFLQLFDKGAENYNKIPGLTYRKDGKVFVNGVIEPIDFNSVPFLYSILECEEDKVIYYESARGCPFRCSYCLSSIDKNIRPLDMERAKSDLGYFLFKKVMQVKFIDRTFNYDEERAYEIFKYLIDNDNGVTNFHFELCADLLSQKTFDLLKSARKGLFQFEIGIQSTNPETLLNVNRKENVYPVLYNVEKLVGLNNAHIHVDLIAGLPFETYEIFERSFNKVYKLKANAFQLGFLKVLKGTPIIKRVEEYGIVYRDRAPYEVISTKWISAKELVRLHQIEKMLDLYYNRGGFGKTLDYIMSANGLEPFKFYENLADFFYESGYQNVSHKKENLYRILRKFAVSVMGSEMDEITDLLVSDMEEALNPEEVKRILKRGWEI